MNDKKMKIANASALAMAVIWLICSIGVWLLPDFSMKITNSWMHGMDVGGVMGMWSLTWSNFLVGGVSAVLASWLVGYIFAWALEKTSK
jgi:hypothetical protein